MCAMVCCVCVEVREQLEISLFPLWDSGMKFRWSDLHSKCPYLLSHVAGLKTVFHTLTWKHCLPMHLIINQSKFFLSVIWSQQ